ncbi:3-hydroxyacyl-CoA dehydrogenase [Insolitispirillum peregrinum]|nr:3-hydroxyacyl-CoA dehydrogenase [Insolitispirillum peregrinum]
MSALPLSTPVAVVGAGAMGSGIAHIAARAGHPVFLYDSRSGAAADAVASQRASFATLAQKGKLDADTAHAASAALQAVDTLDDLAGAGLVIEAIIEDLTVKQELFRRLEAVTAPDCILASNTSSLSITAIASALDAPQRLAGLHFFNPAPLMALVEVVSGLATAPAVVDTLMATAQGWGKTPVRTGSTPGFIVNRVARPYYAEALRLLDEQVSDTATLDALYRDAGGFRMGPFELMDLIGHDVNFAVTSSVWRAFFHDPRFTPSLIQQELVAAGFLGRKSGRGFYDHRGGERPDVQVAPHCPAPDGIVLHGDHPATAALTARLQAHGVACQHQPADDDRLATVGSAVLYPTDGRSAAQRAASSGITDTAVLDLALDYQQASRLAMACAPHCTPAARHALTGLLQAAGIAVSWLVDSPALAVMRTVAMLANEAGDAVHHGVCSAAAADTAMRLGANYPCGPLAWADRIGVATVVQVLDHLAAYYGEDRYRLSPYLRSCLLSGRPCHA